VLALSRGQEEVSAFGRRIPRRLIQKALAVLSASALLVIVATLTIMVSDGLALLPGHLRCHLRLRDGGASA